MAPGLLQISKHQIITQDGVVLSGNLLIPPKTEDKPAKLKGIVQINPSTGAKTSYYMPFAEYLCAHNYAVFVWNYRGFCDSRLKPLKEVNYKFTDFGFFDIPAVTGFLKQKFPDVPLYCVGHSAGGQQIGFSSNNASIKGLLAVAVSCGYPYWMPFFYMLQTLFFFWIFSPISVFLVGYVAAQKFRIMEDLPRKLIGQWRRLCHERDYIFSNKFYGKTIQKGNYQDLPFPVVVITASDDPISNRKAVARFWSHVKSRRGIQFKWYEPKQIGQKSLGHFGYFRSENKDTMWKDMLTELEKF